MPKVFTIEDTGDALQKLFRKVGDLERMVTRPDVMGSSGFGPDDTITVGGINIGPPGNKKLLDLNQAPVTGSITLATGAYMGDIFVDVSWTAVADTPTYEVEMTKVTAPGVYEGVWSQMTGANNIRFRGLEPNVTYGFRIYAINFLGIRSTPLPSTDWNVITTGEDTTIPPPVSSVILARGATSVIVKFSPLTEAQAPDVANGNGTYHIQISTDGTFSSVSQEKFDTATIVQFSDIAAENTYYARVRAIDRSGNASAWTNSSGGFAGGVIDSMLVGDFSAAHITFGTMAGDRITANSLDVAKLKTSSLTAADITLAGGQFFIGSPPTNGLVINSNGIRAYKAGATTLWIDASGNCTFVGAINGSTVTGGQITGSAIDGGTITGTLIRTAVSGRRLEFGGVGATADDISFFSGSPTTEYFRGSINTDYINSGNDTRAHLNFFSPSHVFGVNGANFSLTGPSINQPTTKFEGTFGEMYVRSDSGVQLLRLGGATDAFAISNYSGAMLLRVGGPAGAVEVLNGDLHIGTNKLRGSRVNAWGTQGTTIVGYGGNGFQWNWDGAAYQTFVDGSELVSFMWDGSYMNFYWAGGFACALQGTKSFTIPHPQRDDSWLVHACLEGPTSDVYYRGKGRVVGRQEVTLPAYFTALVDEDTADVWVNNKRLDVGQVKNGKFTVTGPRDREIVFSWLVMAERKDVPKLKPEPKKSDVVVHGFGPYTFLEERKAA